MSTAAAPRVIALEEHYTDAEVARHLDNERQSPKVRERLENLGELRLKEMDEAGIDLQVLSHNAPATHRLDAATAVPLARGANDRLARVVRGRPDRFAGFATLPAIDPAAAADELDRCVSELGFKGAMIHGLTHGLFIDDKRFWPIFQRAEKLDVPIYLHPAVPHPAVVAAYYQDYVKEFPAITNAAWGFTVETATQGVRMVLSGLFDACPALKIIIGHLGEGLPFSLWRIDYVLSRMGNRRIDFREIFRRNFWITTSGNFSTPALLCSMMEMGVDRILFSVDYPFVDNKPGTEWMAQVPLSTEDREKILGGNARRLLRI